jgi:hypothetical protein
MAQFVEIVRWRRRVPRIVVRISWAVWRVVGRWCWIVEGGGCWR